MFSFSKVSAALLLLAPLFSNATPLEKRETYDVNITLHDKSNYASDGFNLTSSALSISSGEWIVQPATYIPRGGNTTFSFTSGVQTSPAGMLLNAVIPYRAQMTEFGNGPYVNTYLVFELNTAQRSEASFTVASDDAGVFLYSYYSLSDDLSGLGTHTIDVYIQDA